MIDGSYRFAGYGASVRVDAPRDVPLSQLCKLVAPEIKTEVSAHGPSDLHLTRWNGDYHLVHGERRYGPYRALQSALRGVSNAVHFLLGKRSPMIFLHAGAVEIDGAAVVFPGRSRYGKSRLVSALIEQGCGYLSDAYAVISPEGAVFPLSRPIRLRGENGVEYASPKGVSAPGGYRCAGLILVRYSEGARWEPRRLTSGQAVLEIAPCVLQGSENPEQVLPAIVALARHAACYQSERGNGEPTAEALRDLLRVSESTTQEARA